MTKTINFKICKRVKSLPNNIILDYSKMKVHVFANNKMNVTEKPEVCDGMSRQEDHNGPISLT